MIHLKHFFSLVIVCVACSSSLHAADGKLIATAGLIQVEGSGGGGIVPWATLAGYDSRDEFSINAFSTMVNVDDYRLQVIGASLSLFDRVELSTARHSFTLKQLGGEIEQNVFGAKLRVYGDVVYSKWPQVSVGILHKQLQDKAIARAVGAVDTEGTDIYVAATKVHLGAVAGYNLLWNATLRFTKANQLGLLGFGGPIEDNYQLMAEASVGILFSRNLAFGLEYRQKPNNLGLGEEDWSDLFITYIPSKRFNLTLAWAMLGSIAGASDQNGIYLSLGGQL